MKHAKFDKELGHMVLLSCAGQTCGMCKTASATHKVGQDEDEAVFAYYPDGGDSEILLPHHPLTQYVCCGCFKSIMGWIVNCGGKNGRLDV